MIDYLLRSFSGPAAPFMYALTALLAFAIAVTIERAWSLWRYRSDPATVLDRAGRGEVSGDRPMERVVAAGLAQDDPELSWEAMGATALGAELEIRRRIPYLSTVASVSTMVGLVGTVYGLILAFGAMGELSGAERAARLSEGSATAMATTAFGLVVAIPAMLAHAVIDAQARELIGRIEEVSRRVLVLRKARGR